MHTFLLLPRPSSQRLVIHATDHALTVRPNLRFGKIDGGGHLAGARRDVECVRSGYGMIPPTVVTVVLDELELEDVVVEVVVYGGGVTWTSQSLAIE